MLKRSPIKSKPYVWKKKPKKKGKGLFDHLKKESKIDEWVRIRAELFEKFNQLGITSCELNLKGCTKNYYLGFAHSKKRKEIATEQPERDRELAEVALLCTSCHQQIEYLPSTDLETGHGRMYRIITNIINNRK